MWHEKGGQRWLSCIDPALAIGRVIITTGKECTFQIKPRHQMQKKLNTYPAADTDLNAWSKYQKYPTRLLVAGEIQRWCDFDQSLIVPILQLRDRYSQSMWPKVTLSNSCIVLTIASSSILQTIGAVVTRTRAIFHVGKSAACDRNWPLWGRDFGCRPDWKKQTKAGFARLEVFESCKWLLMPPS